MNTVLITGAAGGLGKATAETFFRKSFHVIATDIHTGPLPEREDPKWTVMELDVTDPVSVKKAAAELKSQEIRIGILVNIAGVFDVFPLVEDNTSLLRNVMDVNLFGPALMTHTFLGDLVSNRGRVINISSESVKFPGLFQPYQVSKTALEAYHRSVSQELALKGVKTVLIKPGAIRTPMVTEVANHENPFSGSIYKKEFETFSRETTSHIARILEPEKVAELVLRAATARNPRYVYTINHNPRLTFLSLLPGKWVDRMVTRIMKKG